jgi:hypothetical protein
MDIILKNIPPGTTYEHIRDFIEPAIKGSLLRKSGRIENISILVQKACKKYDLKYYGLVTIIPDAMAEQAIRKLNRKKINGRNINVVEYRIRRWHNDRRGRNYDKLSDTRFGDRRRNQLGEVEDSEHNFR